VSALGSQNQHSSVGSSSVSLAPGAHSSKHILKQDFSKPSFCLINDERNCA